MSDPLVSVIIPTFQRERYIAEAIQSALSQSYRNLEILIIDDGSTDSTHAVITDFQKHDQRIQYHYQANSGPANARNSGIRMSKGSLIAFLDSDEKWMDNKLQKEIDIFRTHPEVGFVFSNGFFIDDKGLRDEALTRQRKARKTYRVEDFLFGGVTFLSTSGITIRKECLKKAGIFDETLPLYEDVDLWFRILLFYPAYFIDEELVVNRTHPQNYAKVHVRFPGLEMSRSIWLMRSKATKLYEKNVRPLSAAEKEAVLYNFQIELIKEFFATGFHKEARKEISSYLSTHRLSMRLIFFYLLSFAPVSAVSFVIGRRRQRMQQKEFSMPREL